MTSRTRIEKLQRTIEKIRRQNRAGVGIIAPDADGGYILTCTAYDVRKGETRQQTHYNSIEDAGKAHSRFVQTHPTPTATPLIIIDV